MLSPNQRSLATAALTPPPGTAFAGAVLLTYSLDPAVLLTVPLHLALLGGSGDHALRDGVAVLEAVRRLSGNIAVFTQQGRIQVPQPPTPLYGLLESMVHEVNAPLGGAFHAKLWLMRFRGPERTHMRLVLPTRNLTMDRSWDLALTLDGVVESRPHSRNKPLADLLTRLPEFASTPLSPERLRHVEEMREDLRRVSWELPWGYTELEFRVLGLKRGGWKPTPSFRLAVLSPFCSDGALAMLSGTTREAVALISRPETLEALGCDAVRSFGQRLILHEAAESEDGEDVAGRDTLGLHAKLYVAQSRWDTQLTVGSANATSAALLAGINVEILAELTGRTSRVGGVDALLAADGLQEVLTPAEDTSGLPAPASEQQLALHALEQSRRQLAACDLWLRCEADGASGSWHLELLDLPDGLAQGQRLRIWPITVTQEHAVEPGLDSTLPLALGSFAASSLTGLIAFELSHEEPPCRLRFVLNLPLEGLPAERDSAILQTVVRNREGFVRYLLLLLGGDDSGLAPAWAAGAGVGGAWRKGGESGLPLLEELVRAYSRNPGKLKEVAQVIHLLRAGAGQECVLPEGFLETWQAFEQALETPHA